jgi:hypothetical protein
MNSTLSGILSSIKEGHPTIPSNLTGINSSQMEIGSVQALPIYRKATWINMLCNYINRVEANPEAIVMLGILLKGKWHEKDTQIPVSDKFQAGIARIGVSPLKLNILCSTAYG